jgi:plasmid maintenance system antidote protein VapI
MEMHDPVHPGEIVREECLKPLGLIVTAAAAAFGFTRRALSTKPNHLQEALPVRAAARGN